VGPGGARRRPLRSAADLIAAARKEPGKINYGSGGNGSPQHIAMALFASQAGVQMTHVPYKGATQAAMGVAGNEVQASFQGIATINSLVRSGKVRLIGVTTPQRMPQFPEVPTVAQSGLPGFEIQFLVCRDGAGRHAPPIVDFLHAEITKALADREVRENSQSRGSRRAGLHPMNWRGTCARSTRAMGN